MTAADAFEVGWLVGLVDVTSERQAEEQRASLLRFLSHDLKAPQSSILALTQLQRTSSSPLPEAELLDRIAQQARNALTLTDSFMQLTKAEFGAMNQALCCCRTWFWKPSIRLGQRRDSDPSTSRATSRTSARWKVTAPTC